jgi:hypothetical protein
LPFAALLILALPIRASESIVARDKDAIDKILRSIPSNDRSMPYKTLAERLPNLGLNVSQIIYGPFDPDEIKLSQGQYRKGDIFYSFSTNEPNEIVKRICPIVSSFSLIKRGNRWIPYDRTSKFLLNGYVCAAP